MSPTRKILKPKATQTFFRKKQTKFLIWNDQIYFTGSFTFRNYFHLFEYANGLTVTDLGHLR